MARRIALIAMVALIAVSALAEERIRIERIEVRNTQRVSPQLIAAETLLRPGHEYSETAIHEAMMRLMRLPFVLKADYAMDGGVLVINLTEMNRFAFLLDARGISLAGVPLQQSDLLTCQRLGVACRSTSGRFEYDFTDPTTEWKNAAAGVRWLTGGAGVAHFGMTVLRTRHIFGQNHTALELGYTRYGLFGSRFFATVNVRTPIDSVAEGTFTPSFTAGAPLTVNQTLTAEYEDTLFERKTIPIGTLSAHVLRAERLLTLAWTYDTTNEPYAPTNGTLVRIAPFRWMLDRTSFQASPTMVVPVAGHAHAQGVDVTAIHHWELSDVNSLSAGLLGGWSTIDERHPTYKIVQAGYSRAVGASRAELTGRFVVGPRSVQVAPFGASDGDQHSFEFAADWVQRRAWGTLRFGMALEKISR